MNMTGLRAGALACALLTTTCLTAPALAQSNQSAQPAVRGVDDNGVDLISGTYPFTIVEGTIGSGDTGLSVVRTGMNNYGTSAWQNMFAYQTISGSVTTVVVTLGDSSETFTSTSGGAFVAAQGNGATLTGGSHTDFTYTDAGGTAMTFGAPVDDQYGASPFCAHAASNLNGCFALPTGITRPDQAATTLTWDVHSNCATQFNDDGGLDCQYGWRLGEVANSFGYTLDFAYVSNSVALHSNPSGDWFKRSGATLANGATNASIGYNYVSSTVTEITDTGGRVWRVTTGTNSLGLRRPGSSSDDISVTFSGGLVTQVVRDGITTTYSRSTSGSNVTTTITDAASHVTSVVVDASIGRITSVTDPLSHTTSYTYDGSGRLTRTTMPEGNYVNYTYDGRGNVTETRAVAKSGSGVGDIVASASYDSSCSNVVTCNQPNSTTDARGHTTDYTYDSTHGGVLTVTPPAPSGSGDRPQTRYSYSISNGEYRLTGISACASGTASGSPSCVGTLNESRTVIGYDANGNPNSVEQRSGNTSGAGALSATAAATYDGYGNLLTVDGPLSGSDDTVRYRYNSARQVVGVIGPDPDGGGSLHYRALRTTYGSDGQATAVARGTVNSQSDSDWNTGFTALEEVDTEYDSHHRPVVQRLASGGTTYQLVQTSYDSLGRPNCTAQRMNRNEFATASLPSDACTLDTQGSGADDFGPDRITRTSFDNAGRPNLVQTGYAVSGVQADEVATTYTTNGQVATVTDAEGNRTTYEYDGDDRLVKIRMPDPSTDNTSSTTDYEQLTLDANGNVTSRRLRDGNSIGFTYDYLNRVTAKDLPGSELDVAYGYDLLGRMTSAATSAQTLSFAFDALGRNASQAGPRGTLSYAYDLAGRRTQMTYADSGLYLNYDYDTAGDLTKIRENGATSGAGLLATYAYDDRGRRTSLTRGNGAVTNYTYDNVSRLTELAQNLTGTSGDLTLDDGYDPAGGIVSHGRDNTAFSYAQANTNVSNTVNGLNQVTATGGTSISHDSRGNVSAIGASSYGYSAENLMTSAPSSGALAYDPANRLYQAANGSTTTRFAYDGDEMIAEYDGSNALQRRYVFGPGSDEPLVWYEGTGTSTRRYFHADERGSVVAISDDSGNLYSNRNLYDEYGNTSGTLTGRFGYTGQAWIAEAGMAYYRARMYNASLGRFMQTDPVGFDGGMNWYAYVLNDPTNFTDPTGLGRHGDRPVPPKCINQCVTLTGGILGGTDHTLVNGPNPTLFTDAFGTYGYNSSGHQTYIYFDRSIFDTFNLFSGMDSGRESANAPGDASDTACQGPVLTVSPYQLSGTLFYKWSGLTSSIGPSISIPVGSLASGSLRGVQFSLNFNFAHLRGLGFFAGGGPGGSVTLSDHALPTGASHTTSDMSAIGAAWDAGGELSVGGLFDPTSDSIGGGWGEREGYGGFAGHGTNHTHSIATPQIGC